MLKKIIDKLFYNPNKIAAKLPNVSVSSSTVLLPSCRFRFDVEPNDTSLSLGEEAMVGCTFIFESKQGSIEVGDRTFINGNTLLISRTGIKIGSNVTIAWGCTIYDHNSHSLDYLNRRDDMANQLLAHKRGENFISNKNWATVKSAPITIEDDVWIGMNCIILKGVTIGEGAIVGAGSVVKENVEPWTVVVGNPAKVVKRLK